MTDTLGHRLLHIKIYEDRCGALRGQSNASGQCPQSCFCPWIGCSPFTEPLPHIFCRVRYFPPLQQNSCAVIPSIAVHAQYFVLIWMIWSPSQCHVMCLWSSRSVSLSFAFTFLTFLLYHSRPCTCLESPAATVWSFNATYPCCRRSMFLIHFIYLCGAYLHHPKTS